MIDNIPAKEELLKIDFADWVRERCEELVEKTSIGSQGEDVDIHILNQRLCEFGGDFAWAIAQAEIADHQFRTLEKEFEIWQSDIFVKEKKDKETIKSIEARIAVEHKSDMQAWYAKLENAEHVRNVLKSFKGLWEKMANVYQTLACNLREGYKNVDGVYVGTGQSYEDVKTGSGKYMGKRQQASGMSVGAKMILKQR